MRWLMTFLIALALGAPAFAQEVPPPPPPKEDEKKEEKKDEEPKMSEEGQKLFADVKLVYAKYYEIILAKTKANEEYKAEDVWETAVKEAKNTKYKDRAEFHDAVAKMKAKDRLFRKDVNELITKHAKEYAEAVKKWSGEKDGG